MNLKKGDKIRINKLETVVEFFRGIEGNEQFPLMVGTEYGEFHSDLVEKIEEELTYAPGYSNQDLSQFVGIVPCRELQDCEELDGICQIHDQRTGIWYLGFAVKVWDTASIYNTIWIGSKLAEIKEK